MLDRNNVKLCFTIVSAAGLALLAIGTGCSRTHYRLQADQDVYAIYAEKQAEEAYTLPPLPGIDVGPRSRFFDPSPDDCPALPHPVPVLYGYDLPPLATGDPTGSRDVAQPEPDEDLGGQEELEPGDPSLDDGSDEPDLDPGPEESLELLPPVSDSEAIETVSFEERLKDLELSDDVLPPLTITPVARLAELIRQEAVDPNLVEQDQVDQQRSDDESAATRVVPIPDEFWNQLPETCVPRMLEFQSVQQEFLRSFSDATVESVEALLSDSPRLTLPMIMELATLNNRALQTQKERLYRAALVLTGERFEYLLRPVRRGNGTAVDYRYFRVDNRSSSSLGIPSAVAVRKTTATAGQFLASFANDVALTFNGTQGFAANIGTDLLIDFQQTLFQRDVVFEDLTQAERNVVYEARDLIRFQRSLFVSLATRYYRLLQTYRQIEISSQDYFSNLRAFLQGRAESSVGRIPRVQVDQFEQNALGSRSNLVGDCNDLEDALDQLKLQIGLPPELPLNLDLQELESLTTSDELTVSRQLVLRAKSSLNDSVGERSAASEIAVNSATVLVNRLREAIAVRRQIAGTSDDEVAVAEQKADEISKRLALLEAKLQADLLEKARDQELDAEIPPDEIKQFARTLDLINVRLLQAERGLNLRDPPNRSTVAEQIEAASAEADGLVQELQSAIANRQFDQLPRLVDRAGTLLADVSELTSEITDTLVPQDESEQERMIIETVAEAVQLADAIATSDVGGLDPVDIEDDRAMLLALYQRLEIANGRGDLADARRQIKLAADDLRAIVDLRASHLIQNDRSVGDVLDFTIDRGETRLSLGLDTPLNRRLERNTYRAALINYNATRRALIELEDEIKFAIRGNLRQLRLRRNQYEISVARAALAYERVVSTRLQLKFAFGNVVARDFLEAQQAYTSALSSVASDHISFIVDRINLYFDTESIRLNEFNYWPETQEETLDLPPVPDFFDANPNPYGRLPPCLKYSDEVRQNH